MEPTCPKPTINTNKDNNNCFFTFSNQYKKNNRLDRIKKGTAKLNTAKKAKLFGAT